MIIDNGVNYGTTTTPAAKTYAASDRAKRLHFAHHPTDSTQRSKDGQVHWPASDLWYFLHLSDTDAGHIEQLTGTERAVSVQPSAVSFQKMPGDFARRRRFLAPKVGYDLLLSPIWLTAES